MSDKAQLRIFDNAQRTRCSVSTLRNHFHETGKRSTYFNSPSNQTSSMSTHRFIALEVIFAIVIGIHRLQATFNAQGGTHARATVYAPSRSSRHDLGPVCPTRCRFANRECERRRAGGLRWRVAPASSGQSPASGASAGASYRVEEDMLAYQAADVVAAEIANNVKNQRLILYDQPTFINLQFYEAYAAEIATLESAYERITTSHASYGALDFPGSATAAQTIIGTLAAMRSTTDIGSQQTSSQIDAIIALLAKHLVNPSAVVVPKLLLATPFDLKITGAASNSDCNNINKSVPDQLACLLTVRAAAASQGNNEEFQTLTSSFSRFSEPCSDPPWPAACCLRVPGAPAERERRLELKPPTVGPIQ